jgi:hypothetical protein
MARILAGILLFGLALTPAAARALCVDTVYSVLAFSPDGDSVLLEERAHGPEGGGSLAYLLLSATAPTATRFSVSSNFSPGDGSEPESVSTAQLQKTLRALAEAVKRKKLAGVQVTAANASRVDMVRLQPSAARGTGLAVARGELVGGGLRISLKGNALTVSDRSGSQALRLWAPLDSIKGLSASMAAQGKLLVLARDRGRCDRSIAVLHTPSGKARELRVLPLPR